MHRALSRHHEVIKKIDIQQKLWLIVSAVIFFIACFTVYDWCYIRNTILEWILFSVVAVASTLWWYWTVKTLNTLLRHSIEETRMIGLLLSDLKEVYNDIKELK
jgi:hypothetical protein